MILKIPNGEPKTEQLEFFIHVGSKFCMVEEYSYVLQTNTEK